MSAAQAVAEVAAIPVGLSTTEAARRRSEVGPNATIEERAGLFQRVMRHCWAPVPWMLEVTIVLQVIVGERFEGLLIAILLVLNVALGVFQETHADAALDLLKRRLSPRVRVRRDGTWTDLPTAELVPGDVVQVPLGGIVPADVRIIKGLLLLDQSMLTGESIPVETAPQQIAYAGAQVRRGEAIAEVVSIGAKTYFGRTAELVRVAHVESSEQRAVLGVVRALTVVNFAIVVAMVAYAHTIRMDVPQIIPLVLTALLSAVPVALPATFSLAAALGAKSLAVRGVLLTRLSALNEAAMIDVLCVDKTGTLTENELAVTAVRAFGQGYGEADVLAFAAAASSPDGQDPIDTAVRSVALRSGKTPDNLFAITQFTPFDPAAKMAEAIVRDHVGKQLRVVKGSPMAVAAVAPMAREVTAAAQEFGAAGYRTLAVAVGPHDKPAVIGLIAFSDPPRADSSALLAELRSLGVRTVMVTGDTAGTAATVASAIGLNGSVCPPGPILEAADPENFSVYAGVFPEDKFRLVKAFQRCGHVVGMCGDGANDAPALRQAQMGIAVSTATDVAKAAAGIVLIDPGLSGIVTCIKEGRAAFQRVLTYTLSILVNKCATLFVMGAGLVMTEHAVLTPLLQALSMLAGDLVTMSRAADRAKPSPYPNNWRIRNLTLAAIPLGSFKLCYCAGVLAVGWFFLHLSPSEMQTLTFLMLVLAGQANIYVLRERDRFWRSHPARIMLIASATDVAIVTSLALGGVMMAPLAPIIVGLLFLATGGYALTLDTIKVLVRRHLRID